MLSYDNKDIFIYEYDAFVVLYNSKNGKNIAIPREQLCYLEEYIKANDFYSTPVLNDDNRMITLGLNISNNCNLSCSYCFNADKSNRKLSIKDVKKFVLSYVKKFPDSLKYVIDLSGSGEPLLELPLILEIADFVEKLSNKIGKEFLVQFICNGTLLSTLYADLLKKHKVLFGISFDGIKEYHDKNRRDRANQPTFDWILQNYNLIPDKTLVGAGMTYVPNDFPPIFDSYLYLADTFQTFSIRIARGTILAKDEYLYLEKEYTRLKEYLMERISNQDIKLLCQITNGDDYFGRYLIKACCDAYVEHRCDAGRSRFSLGVDKQVYICSAAVNTSLHEKMNDKLLECSCCEIRNTCGGECQINLHENRMDKNMCELKRYFHKLSLEIIGYFQIMNPSLYQEYVYHIEDVLKRYQGNDKLVELYPYVKKKMKFSHLKELYDCEPKEFSRLYREHIHPF